MSRLCCSDPELFGRYSNAQLETDLSVKSSVDSAIHPVSLRVLQTYSDQLADIAEVGLSCGNSDLVLVDVPPKALEVFIHAVYGKSFTETLVPGIVSDCDIRSVQDVLFFGHKYNINQVQPAICDIITSHLDEFASCDNSDVIEFYNKVPTEYHAVQDAIFQIMLRKESSYGFWIINPEIAIAHRHVNEILAQDSNRPDWNLKTLKLFTVRTCDTSHSALLCRGWFLFSTMHAAGAARKSLGFQGSVAHFI